MTLKDSLRIAKNEFLYLLLTPIGWVILALFIVQIALTYMELMDFAFGRLAFGNNPFGFAAYLFTLPVGTVFSSAISDVYLIIPLVTMAVFSREFQSGSIKLLMSSPVRPHEIVIGKYLGIAAFLLVLISFLVLLVFWTWSVVPNFDILATLPGLLGIYLLVCTYAAIGIFVSSLTRYQVIAAIVTLGVLFVLRSAADWAQTIPILNEVTAWASVAGRAGVLQEGLISTPDIVYFVTLVFAFLAFTIIRISALRSGEGRSRLSAKAAAISLVALSVGWLFSLPALSLFIDTTYDRRNSLAPETVAAMQHLDGPWEIETYSNFLDRMGVRTLPEDRIADRRRWAQYRQINPDLKMSYRYFYDIDAASQVFSRPEDGRTDREIVDDYIERRGLRLPELKTGEELSAETGVDLGAQGYRSIRLIKWNGGETVLRHFNDPRTFAGEPERAAAILKLVGGAENVGFVSGRGERSIEGIGNRAYRHNFARLDERFSLINHGLEIESVDPAIDFPNHINTLVIADPQSAYSEQELSNLAAYINGGRDFIVLVEPSSAKSLSDVLELIGVDTGRPIIQQSDPTAPPEFVLANASPGIIDQYLGDVVLDIPVVIDGGIELSPALEDKGFAKENILSYRDMSVGYALERNVDGRRQKGLVFGDADIFSNANRARTEPTNNRFVASSSFFWLTDGTYPVKRTTRSPIDRDIAVERKHLQVMRWILVGGFPVAVLLAGGMWLLRRRAR